MNERQRKFADYYIETANATQSAIKAGYSKKYANTNASKLLQNTTISNYIQRRMENHRKKRIADQEEILQYLTRVIRGEAIGKEKLGVGRGAEQIVDRNLTTQDRIRAAEHIGQQYGMWKDRHEVEHKLPTIIDDVPEEDE